MAFIRTKNIKKKSGNIYTYAYLVENRWKKKKTSKSKSRQKVKKYLGRVYTLNRQKEIGFIDHFHITDIQEYITKTSERDIIIQLVKLELINHGFEEAGKLISDEKIFFDEDKIEFSIVEDEKTKKGIVISINEGYLCKHTIRELINFNKQGSEEEVGYEFAKAFVETGLKVPPEIFVGLFGKIYKL